MVMKVATVEILIEKARLEPQVAVAVAQAMDEAMDEKVQNAQWVTVPIMDARFAAVDARFAAVDTKLASLEGKLRTEMRDLKTELLHHVYATFATQVTLLLGVLYFVSSQRR